MTAVTIRPDERLVTIGREPHARRRRGQHVQWFIADKHGFLLLCSGKLSALQAYINEEVATAGHERVHLGGLYESMGRADPRTGGFYQHRWRVSCAPLEDAARVFEALRPSFARAVLVGAEGAYAELAKPLPNGRVLFAGEAYTSCTSTSMTVHAALNSGVRAASEAASFLPKLAKGGGGGREAPRARL